MQQEHICRAYLACCHVIRMGLKFMLHFKLLSAAH